MSTTGCIVLAGGAGKRMKSEKPKVLCEVLKKPMLGWVLDCAKEFGFDKIGVVSGYKREMTEKYLTENYGDIPAFYQDEQKGTGDAVSRAEELIRSVDRVCVLCGDAPFMDAKTLEKALALHEKTGAGVTVISAELENPFGYGRIIRDGSDKFSAIREQKDCSPEEAKICEINSGAYWFDSKALLSALPKITNKNASGEFYLTDCVEIIGNAQVYKSENPAITYGANTRADLYMLNEKARANVFEKLMNDGVSFISTDGIIIGNEVKIGADTLILPDTIILGNTVIGKNCEIGANSRIEDCTIGDNVVLDNVKAVSATIEDNVKIGPFAQLRPGTVIRKGVKIGDFVEIKNSDIGENTAVAHLTYLGDSDVGRGVNFGCGCVTANYDGINKYRTEIGDDAFIGCNTNLIAPVKVGNNATTAAGSTITKDVPENSLAVERGQMRVIENWDKNFKRKKK
ncbi:MAG: bifunctional UDP-N-acetylglucosamine diphosphorylase/glucosamine-1-phosphate N-acetyltransferase GlmU [Oscillospiraceae bacterium]|nr:bifunctional UDP-N-acetylglucosamine diphosphorylase/glucosamine-1-phosphate N-acetyltransferase GlmU [Oscillospiraceae bacterium]